MTEFLLIGLASIIVLGIFAQWISWYLKLPSILLLLLFGFLVGPITGLLRPDEFFGDLLFPFVSISVAIILFEGGLSLKLTELSSVFGIVRNLITIGTIVTWGLSTLALYYFSNIPLDYALLIGAVLVVTGPTVIIPLLRIVKPKGQINSILKWEGIVNDPIGALLALLVFDSIIAVGVREATLTVVFVVLKTVLISSIIGLLGGYLIVYFIRKDFIPDYLQNPATLAALLLIYASSNTIQTESGLFAVTLMGIYLANQKQIVVEHIIAFKENLGVLLLSALFILLAARLNIQDFELLDSGIIIFLVFLIIIVRPAAIFLSTIKSNLNWKEKLYLSWMAPRGIVAAAVASIFSIELSQNGFEGANILVPIMFLVIISTILVYGLSAIPLAKLLKLSDPDPQGILIAGINKFSLAIAEVMQKYSFRVLLVDTNWDKVTTARQLGAETCFGSIVSEKTIENIELEGIGRFIALTSNKGINSLAAIQFGKIFDSANTFQINSTSKQSQKLIKELRGHFFSSESLIYSDIEKYENSLYLKVNKITEEFSYKNLIDKYGLNMFHPLFKISLENKLTVYSEKFYEEPAKGDIIVSLILEDKDNQSYEEN